MNFPQFFKSGTMALIAVLITVRAVVADWYLVPTGSMNPTIQEGDFIFVNKLAYGANLPFTDIQLLSSKQPVRGDVVVFIKAADNTRMVKRLIGVPGDTVQLKDNVLWLNGEPAQYFLIESTGDKFIVREQIDSLTTTCRCLFARKAPNRTRTRWWYRPASTWSWATTAIKASTHASSVSSIRLIWLGGLRSSLPHLRQTHTCLA